MEARRWTRATNVLLVLGAAALLLGCTSGPPSTAGSSIAIDNSASPPLGAPGQADRRPAGVPFANRLAESASPYLRAGGVQPVSWQPFDRQSLALARALDRPILLDVGATWCHWCRVMASESYQDADVAGFINENFVPIKIDADQQPDLDRRYQRSAQLITGQAGWPLTLFLTPAGDAFAGGTYFPSGDDIGLPDFKSVLQTVSASFRESRDAVEERGVATSGNAAFLGQAGVVAGALSSELVDKIAAAILSAQDDQFGGLGQSAKFIPTQAIELALRSYQGSGDLRYLSFATRTLDAMAVGAVRDQLSGAFHRHSLDRSWNVPQFEIIGSLNGAIALSYLHAYQLSGDPRYRAVAEKVIDYLNQALWDESGGGFHSTQDGDSAQSRSEGDYFTWSADEVSDVLPPDETAAALLYYGFDSPGGQSPPGLRAPLRVAMTVSAVAAQLGLPADEARARLDAARQHLLAARGRRGVPRLDRSFYIDRNSSLASALLQASSILERGDLRERALRTLDRVVSLPRQNGLLSHSYAGDLPIGVPLLDDQAALVAALEEAFVSTGEAKYLQSAGQLLDSMAANLTDGKEGPFLEKVRSGADASDVAIGSFDDGLILSGNPLAASALDRYATLSADPRYHQRADGVLRAFAGAAAEYGPFAAGYALAVDYHLQH